MDNFYRHDAGDLKEVWSWVDPRFGIIRKISRLRLKSPDPRWWVYACELARAPVGTWHSLTDFSSAGSSIDPDEALRRAFGEAIERYSGLAILDPFEEMLLRPAEIEFSGEFPCCAPDEPCNQSFKDWSTIEGLGCFPMHSLGGGRTVYVPGGFVRLSRAARPDEPSVTLSISTGLAFQATPHMAIWKGICEVVERDP